MLLQIKKIRDRIEWLTAIRDSSTGTLQEQIQDEIDNLKLDLQVLSKSTVTVEIQLVHVGE